MDSLVGKHSPAAARKALENLPKEVDATYDEAMVRIKRQIEDDKELAEHVLSWIAYARRPLSVKKLQYALAVEPNTTHMDLDAIIDGEILTAVCAGLVVVDEERSIIRLVRRWSTPGCRVVVCILILRRLHHTGVVRTQSRFFHLMYLHGVIVMITQNRNLFWRTMHCLIMLLDTGAITHLDWKKLSKIWHRSFFKITQKLPPEFMCLHSLVWWKSPNISWERGPTPMHEAVVGLLLGQENVEVDAKGMRDRTPLSFAAANGHESVVQLLIGKDNVNVDSNHTRDRTPLSFAAANGHGAVVKLLLASNDINGHTGPGAALIYS